MGCSDQKEPSVSGEEKNNNVIRGMIVAPGLNDRKVIAPLEDAWKRIDPKEDGWDSEVLNEVATKKLKALSEIILKKTIIKEKDLEEIESDEYKGSKLRPELLNEIYKNEEFIVKRGHGVSYLQNIQYLEPFLVYPDDITFKQYETIVRFMEERILNFKREFVTRTTDIEKYLRSTYGSIPRENLSILLSLLQLLIFFFTSLNQSPVEK